MRIRVGIVDDHTVTRQGLRAVLAAQSDLEVTGEASNGDEAMALVRHEAVDVLVMDLSMPGKGGVDTLASIRAEKPGFPILILSGFPEDRYAAPLLKQGASGYLNKECEPQELIRAIRSVGMGRRYISPEVGDVLARGLSHGTKDPHELLSGRELTVFLRLAKGETVGDIARDLDLSVKTVSTYRTRILEKMHLSSNSDLTYYAVQNQLIS